MSADKGGTKLLQLFQVASDLEWSCSIWLNHYLPIEIDIFNEQLNILVITAVCFLRHVHFDLKQAHTNVILFLIFIEKFQHL